MSVSGSVRSLRVLNKFFNASSEVEVSWSKPDGGDEIDQYYVEWYQKDQRIGYKYVKHLSNKLNYTFSITSLHLETYKIWVCAENSVGYGSCQSATIATGTSNTNSFC